METDRSPHDHFTDTLLADYVDRLLDRQMMKQVDRHITGCHRCERKVRILRRIGTAVRIAGSEKANPDVTRTVLGILRIPDAPSYTWKFFQSLAPLVGLAILLAAAIGILSATGWLKGTAAGDSIGVTANAFASLFQQVSEAANSTGAWLQRYISFAFAYSTVGLTLFILVFFGILAVVDKFLLEPYMRKRG